MIAEHWAVRVPHFCLAGSRCFAHGILIRISASGFAKSTAVSACRRSQRFSGGWFCQYRPLGFLPGVPAGARIYKAAVMKKGSTFTTEKAAMGGANAWGRKEMRHNKISKMLSDARPPLSRWCTMDSSTELEQRKTKHLQRWLPDPLYLDLTWFSIFPRFGHLFHAALAGLLIVPCYSIVSFCGYSLPGSAPTVF